MDRTPKRNGRQLARTALRTRRELEFLSVKELVAQTGHGPQLWPLVLLKELVDNALDACEEAGVPPEIRVVVDEGRICVSDNGPGIPPDVVTGIQDFSTRISSREAYVAPDRGAQGNALKTVLAIPFALDGRAGEVEIVARGIRHRIRIGVDRIRQQPVLEHDQEPGEPLLGGTDVVIHWPDLPSSQAAENGQFLQLGSDLDDWPDGEGGSPGSILADAEHRSFQLAENFSVLNPHLKLSVAWNGKHQDLSPTDPHWRKWVPSTPTSALWYGAERFERLVAGYIADDADHGKDRTVRDLVVEFKGLSSTAKQKQILEETGLTRTRLTELAADGQLDSKRLGLLLRTMQKHSKRVKPAALGVIGREHVEHHLERLGCEMESFEYKKLLHETDDVPWVGEIAFAWCPKLRSRRLITGVNWSPGILNPLRELGEWKPSLDAVLEHERAGPEQPVVVVLHLADPLVEFTDRGKSAIVMR